MSDLVASENFTNIRNLIQEIVQRLKNIPQEAVTHVQKLADEAEIFLKRTFPLHLSKESECAAHCTNFALREKKRTICNEALHT